MTTRKPAIGEALTTFGAGGDTPIDAVATAPRDGMTLDTKRIQALARAVAARRPLRSPGGATRQDAAKSR